MALASGWDIVRGERVEKRDVCWDESDAELFTSSLTVELCGLNLNNRRSSAAA